jgi:hypothetical protein
MLENMREAGALWGPARRLYQIITRKTGREYIPLPADSAAADTFEKPILKCDEEKGITIKAIELIPISAVGQATNYMTLAIVDKGADGTGTTSKASLDLNSSHTVGAYASIDVVTTDFQVANGEVITLKKTVTGNGQAWPGGLVKITYE